jgi:TonB family protein
VVLSFQINRKGEVGEIRLTQSSGYEELDREGIATLRRASPFFGAVSHNFFAFFVVRF